MPLAAPILDEARRIRALFDATGAVGVSADVLQPAETLLDLYGEDIRARAYVTHDPLKGEMMLRPDFTVPVVQMHMQSQAEPARYTYSGKVFRKQEEDPSRPNEYIQVGYEVFDGQAPVEADAEVFAKVSEALEGLHLRAATGDIGLLLAAVKGLKTIESRKAALLRHVWRPKRFRSLLERFGGRAPVPPTREALLAASDPMAGAGAEIGLRSMDEVAARIAALKEDAAAPAISGDEIALIDAILTLRNTAPNALSILRDIAVDLPAILGAVSRMEQRLEAMTRLGVAAHALEFEGNYGRTSMEYYDGFVFGFYAAARPDLPAVATGGRYDALTRVLGQGRAVPAVGAVIRPDLVVQLRGQA